MRVKLSNVVDMNRCFITTVSLILSVFSYSHIMAQAPQKPFPAALSDQLSIPPVPGQSTHSVLDEIPLAHHGSVAPGSYTSPWLVEIMKLAHAKIEDSVIITFI